MKDGVFVSYSHKDTAVVEKIVAVIKAESGKEVWFDHKLRGGENYFSVIANQILENRYFVFIVSDSSIESDWCLRELEFAASERKQIIAIWLDNVSVSPRIKLVIQNTHYINWYSTTDKLFSDAVGMAFEGNSSVTIDLSSEREDISVKGQRSFLTKDELKLLGELVKSEAMGKYSICFLPKNANLLGMAYECGLLVEADEKRALMYYKSSRYHGDADGSYLYASLMRRREPEVQAHLTEMLGAAERGSVIALTEIGDNYYFGQNGLPRDIDKAYEYFEQAAKSGGAAAMYYTAFGYRNGEGLEKDPELAYMYALKSRELGFPRAFRLLGFMYEDGDFVEKDLSQAAELFSEAAERGDYLSYCYLGWIKGELGNTEEKLRLYRLAVEYADRGDIKSGSPYYRMAVVYDDADGVEQNYDLAAEYYIKALERGHKLANKWAVPCIMNLEGTRREGLLHRALELKCGAAGYELGKLEMEKQSGNGKRLSPEAVGYFEAGAELGNIKCIEKLLLNYSFIVGNGIMGTDREESIKWFRIFFANADEEYLQSWREVDGLSALYYGYAVELDLDSSLSAPDREFVLYNFKKSVEESPAHLGRIIGFAVNGYLFPEESGSGLRVDVPHAEDVLSFAREHLDEYRKYLKEKEPDKEAELLKILNDLMKKGYSFIAKCYDSGKYVPKDKIIAKKYKDLASSVK